MDSSLSERTLPEPARAPWRTVGSFALVVVLLVVAVGLTMRYRHDHRDEWRHETEPWWGFDVSSDGRTLTFHGWGSGPCTEATGVSFSSDPGEGGQISATLDTRTQVVRDGHPVFCSAVLSLDGPIERIRLDRPVPDSTIIVDGSTSGPPDGHPCAGNKVQVVRAPTVLRAFPGCTAVG
jgi:hypothetical protein